MAKKRKLRPSDPEPTKVPEAEPQEEQSQEATVPVEEEQLQSEPEQIQGGDAPQEQQEDMAVEDSKEEEHEEPREEEQKEVGGKELGGEQEEHENLDALKEAQPVTANGTEVKDEEEEDDEDDDEEPVENLLETFSKDQLLTLIKKAVDKHPDLIEGVRELADADPAHRKIFVHGLGWDTTAENLISVFGSYGEIEDCKAVTDRVSGKSKGYAFILFKHRSGARKALRQPQKQIGNRTTSCQLASSGPVPTPPPVTPPVSEYTQRKIFVSNVSAEVDTNKLLDFFKQYGEIEDGPLGLDKQTGKPKGFALFVYKTTDSAKKALEEPHKNFEGHTLHCQKAIDGPKQKHYHQQPPFPHHQHSHYHSRKEKNKYSSAGASGPGHGHLMAPSGPAIGFNPTQGLNPVLGQALSTLLATQGAGLGLGNLLGGLGGAPVNQAGPPAGYGNQAGGGYGNQPLMQGGYQNPQMGQSSAVRPHPGSGPPYMGH
ncbi:UBP1-associated protein 2B-like [Juglans microcarpa x Juglans regia]|uniref:UBP1-associated protein 2B-like n=1 Tax=Juglans microcarpa x Juglans regia TaxID=2249226 RepID=UPI001B7DF329|nr:UBP1-associated protein 2B-like [Juglans microcarpa x Juglans regia]XP_040994634.1 UBP1-associated protein 2B-like [Juglans microcarpa x Juglans regia]